MELIKEYEEMLKHRPDHMLIEEANALGKSAFSDQIDWELESRKPPPEPSEYDNIGSIITGEVIGYVDGKEIWN